MHKIGYAALGLGAGAAIGWAITADVYENKAKEELLYYKGMIEATNLRISELHDRLENPTIEDIDKIPGQIVFTNPITEVVEDSDAVESIEAVEAVEVVEEQQSNVKRLISEYSADPDAPEDFVRQVAASQEPDYSQPRVIPRHEYALDEDEEGIHYEKETVTFYPHDQVVLDDEDEPIVDIQRTLGMRNLRRFGDESGDPNVVFIRNRRLETDYEVVKEDETPLPLHVKYGMDKEEFRANRAAGLIKFREEDE